MTVEMLRLTGDPIAADELELSTLNSALGLFSPTGRWSTYNTPMDGDSEGELPRDRLPVPPRLARAELLQRQRRPRPGPALGMGPDERTETTMAWSSTGTARASSRPGWPRAYGSGSRPRPITRGPGRVQITRRARAGRHVPPPTANSPLVDATPRSRSTAQPVPDVKPATYLELTRTWKPGDVIALELDLTPHLWAGEREVAGRVSLYRGPILLTYDPRFNPGKPDDPPALDVAEPAVKLTSRSWPQAPIVLVEVKTTAGSVLLCDFASAGFDGSSYRSWLRAAPIKPLPFSREHAWRSQPVRGSR